MYSDFIQIGKYILSIHHIVGIRLEGAAVVVMILSNDAESSIKEISIKAESEDQAEVWINKVKSTLLCQYPQN